MITFLGDCPRVVKQEIESLLERGRIVREFTVTGCIDNGLTPSGNRSYQIKIYLPEEGRTTWGCHRDPIEVQLIKGGVVAPQMLPSQELAWNQIKRFLGQFYASSGVEEALHHECRSAYLHGLVDNLEPSLPLKTLCDIKLLIPQLGEDLFSVSYRWYFGSEVPEGSHLPDN